MTNVDRNRKPNRLSVLAVVLSSTALAVSVPAGFTSVLELIHAQSPWVIAAHEERAIAFVRSLHNSDDAGVRRTLAYTESGSVAERLAQIQIDLYRGFIGERASYDFRESAGSVLACSADDKDDECEKFGDFEFNSENEIRDLAISSIPIAALLLEGRSTVEPYESNLSVTLAGARISASNDNPRVWVGLRIENAGASNVVLNLQGAFCQDALGEQTAGALTAPPALGPARRAWAYFTAPCDVGGWVGIPTTRDGGPETISWVRLG